MPCENTFHLKAYDLAGNIAEKSVTPDTPEVLEKPEIREEKTDIPERETLTIQIQEMKFWQNENWLPSCL